MNKEKKTAFWIIFLVMVCVGGVAGGGIYYVGEQVRAIEPEGRTEVLLNTADQLLALASLDEFYFWAIPACLGFFILLGGVIWMAVGSCLGRASSAEAKEKGGSQKSAPAKKDFIDQKIEQERRQRLFLHSLSILQREGRLLDFFDEDLSRYEDAQIGAAVRSIQEDCKKAVKKYIDLRPVLQATEGDPITIEEGFDIDAINLVGNVAGNPPFSGVVRHPGWKAGKKEVPKLTDVQDSSIMTPAEVEIQ